MLLGFLFLRSKGIGRKRVEIGVTSSVVSGLIIRLVSGFLLN
jgi:hypothetical protein